MKTFSGLELLFKQSQHKASAALTLLWVTFFSLLSITAYADGFLSLIPDMPLPAQTNELTDSHMEFDAPNGRVIQISAESNLSQKAIEVFYVDTLPEFGWVMQSSDSYVREEEKLTFSYEETSDKVIILFELSPR